MKQIGKINVDIVCEDIAFVYADVVVVPEFQNCASYGGVGGAIAKTARKGMKEYDICAKAQNLPFGSAVITPAGSFFCHYLAHVVTVGCSKEQAFEYIQAAVEKALVLADRKWVKSVAIPALGTGVIGTLTLKQSAKAIFAAVAEFSKVAKYVSQVKFVVYNEEIQPVEDVLWDESYLTSGREIGEKEFSFGKWYAEFCSNLNNAAPETGC